MKARSIGIIGWGKMGRIRAGAIAEDGRGRVECVYDPVATGIPGSARLVSSPEQVFSNPALDAVVICTPNHLNKPFTLAALRSGKHVFCEKPPAFSAADVRDIRRQEKASGCILMYGFNHRHHPSIRDLKEIVDSGEMGNVLWMRGRYGKEVTPGYFQGWRANQRLAGGGILLDQGIHMLDLLIYLGGRFDEVQAFVSSLHWKIPGLEDNAFVNLRNSRSGVCASLHSTLTQWGNLFSLEVCLPGGLIAVNGLQTASGAYAPEVLSVRRAGHLSKKASASPAKPEHRVYERDDSWVSEMRMFMDSIQSDKPPKLGSSRDALHVMSLIDAMYQQK